MIIILTVEFDNNYHYQLTGGYEAKKVSKLVLTILVSLMLVFGLAACGGSTQTSSESKPKEKEEATPENNEEKTVNIYTARHYEANDEVYKKFTEETGIQVNVVKGEAEELIERLKREGESTEADLFITVDGGVLANAKGNDILQPVTSDIIEADVPENLLTQTITGLEWQQEHVLSRMQKIGLHRISYLHMKT
jgi:ABC-type thiamine transport system substrate-binding protein